MNALTASIEALLAVTSRPLTVKEIASLCSVSADAVRDSLKQLKEKYAPDVSGVVLVHAGDTVQFMTSPDVVSVVEQFVKTETVGELTRPQLEALSIIAYRGPVTKEELERLRGINSTLVLRNLMIRGLVEAHEDRNALSTSYVVTVEFLRHLGMTDVRQFPDYEALSRDEKIDQALAMAELHGPRADASEAAIKESL